MELTKILFLSIFQQLVILFLQVKFQKPIPL